MKVCIVEDQGYQNLFPLTKTRPSFGLRCGRFTIEERIFNVLDPYIERVHYIMRPELEEVWRIRNKASNTVYFDIPEESDCLFLNGRVLFGEESLQTIIEKTRLRKPFVWKDGDMWIAIYLPDQPAFFTAEEIQNESVDFSWFKDQQYMDHAIITYPWDLNRYNSGMICKDFWWIKSRLNRLAYPPLPEQVAILNNQQIIIGKFAEILPFVTIDATEGPVIIGDNVKIESGTYIKGPASIGDDCLVSANTKLYSNTTLGNTCKVGGEISHTIIHGFSNKKHSGFLGNSYLGEWINLGAGTNNSNLKNNYNTITVRINGQDVNTNSQFIGLYMGDHSRSAIGTKFNTATFAGVGCNIFGNGLTPKYIEDFTWGGIDRSDIYNFEKFVYNAYRMMIRREVELSAGEIKLLGRLHQLRLTAQNSEKPVSVNMERENGSIVKS